METLAPSSFSISINGRPIEITDTPPTENLLTFLRHHELTGSKEGCAEGDCGACTVILLDRDAQGKRAYRAINSCIAPIASLAGREIFTVEGFAKNGTLHPVQDAMVKHYGSQCGYCTPGFVASMFEGYYRADLNKPCQIADQLCGNLCRCTGYRPIRDAASEVLLIEKPADDFSELLTGAVPALDQLEYRGFSRPTSLAELFELLIGNPEAKLIGGATEIGVAINKLFRDFPFLVSTEAVPELQQLDATANAWHIGAGCTLTRIQEALNGEHPSLDQMFTLFASRQIRNRATLGGNLATASPIGDSAPALIALDAEIVLATRDAERTIPLYQFFLDYRKTELRPGEIILRIVLPRSPKGRSLFWKVSKRREMDISIVSAAFRMDLAADGTIADLRTVFGGVAATPKRVLRAEEIAIGKSPEAALPLVSRILREEFSPLSDARGSAAYRLAVVESLWEKFIRGGTSYAHDEELTFKKDELWSTADRSRDLRHESAVGHVCGTARYVEDIALRRPMLDMWPVLSPHARARIRGIDTINAEKVPGVVRILTAKDVTGLNNVGPNAHDEPALAETDVFYNGQVVAVVVGESLRACQQAAQQVIVDYEPLPPILSIEQAIAEDSYSTTPHQLIRGDIKDAMEKSPRRLTGTFEFGGQEHFYLESQAAWAETLDDGGIFVNSSTQHPSEIQTIVAEVLGMERNYVVVEAPRMGGGFGGKETQGNQWAALVALASKLTGKPVRVQLDRDLDMVITGKRHPFRAKYEVGFDEQGTLLAAKVYLVSDGGWSLDLSQPINDRALYHLDNAYYIPAVDFSGRVAKTNVTSHTAFRGFGGPQGMLVIEEILAQVARSLKLAPEDVRRRNFYQGDGETNTTHYGQLIENNRIGPLWDQLLAESDFAKRRYEVDQWNATHPDVKRGLAITPVKFGISFTFTPYNQAGAQVLLYRDGSAQVNHGGTEMGQGLHTKVLGIAMRELGLPREKIRLMHTRTDKVPNTSATAASCGADLNGAAVANACEILMTRLAPVAASMLSAQSGTPIAEEQIAWKDGRFYCVKDESVQIPYADVTGRAYLERVNLGAMGFYKTPLIHWNWAIGKGHPFHYYAFGAAVSEVEVDCASGMMQVRRVDILHDVGDSLNPSVDRGQIEGGFVQGLGWLTCEELLWSKEGKLLTHSASTYQIPAFSTTPIDFRVRLLTDAPQLRTVGSSKAVGEPPLMLAISVREAIRDAVAAQVPPDDSIQLRSPSTAEAIYRSLHPDKFSK